jgi:cytidylate kinase
MIICISGLSGSGKNSVGRLVAEKLGMRVVDPTFKTLAAKAKMSLLDFHRKAEHEHSIDKDFDSRLIAEAKRGNCVVTTWLGPWMVKGADVRVWLYAPRESRAMRVASRDSMTFDEALKHISERDESNHARYKEIYGINIFDHSGFELVLNTDRFMPAESADIICAAVRAVESEPKMKIAAGKKAKPERKTKPAKKTGKKKKM